MAEIRVEMAEIRVEMAEISGNSVFAICEVAVFSWPHGAQMSIFVLHCVSSLSPCPCGTPAGITALACCHEGSALVVAVRFLCGRATCPVKAWLRAVDHLPHWGVDVTSQTSPCINSYA